MLIPVRNGQSTVKAAITDLLAGMDQGDEILVVDDGSEDLTPGILNSIQRVDSRVQVVSTSGLGLVGALNVGLSQATHRWIARADADDRYPLGRLPAQRQAIRPRVVLVTGDYRVVTAGRSIGDIPCALTHPFVVASLINPQRVPHPGVLFDRAAVLEAGGYRAEDFPAEDLALWLRLARAGEFVGLPDIAVDWTMSPGSITHGHQRVQREMTDTLVLEHFPMEVVEAIDPDHVSAEMAAYRGTRLAGVRRLLLVRDLHALSMRGGSRAAYIQSRSGLLRHPLGSAAAAVHMAIERRRRDRVRSSFAASSD